MGVLTPGDMSAGEGSTESLNTVLAKDDINFNACFDRGISIEPFVFNDQYVPPLGQLSHGTAIRWFVKQHEAYYQKQDSQHSIYDVADRLCAEDAYGLFFIPYLSQTNCMDTESRVPAAFIGINTSTGVGQMYKAVLEGLSFESMDNLNRLHSLGITPNRIIASGGCVRAEHLMQIKADVFQKPIEIQQNNNAAALGLCMLCAVGCGDVADFLRQKNGLREFPILYSHKKHIPCNSRSTSSFATVLANYSEPLPDALSLGYDTEPRYALFHGVRTQPKYMATI